MGTEALYDISELAQLSGLTVRTIRYYIQQRLLPATGQRGPGAKYDTGHLARLRLIRHLQSQHLPLAEIRRRLEAGEAGAVVTTSAGAPPDATPSSSVDTTSAADYVRSVLGDARVGFASSSPAPSPPRPESEERSHWERISLTGDVELHVRRPLSRVDNRRVERLLEQARQIFREEPSQG